MLTAKNFYRKRKRYFLYFFLVLFVLIFCFVAGWSFSKEKRENAFAKKTFFLLYVEKSNEQSSLLPLQEIIKKLGGGGEILFYDKFYYLTLSVYSSKEDATQVLQNINKNYSGAGILNLERKKFNRIIKSKIQDFPNSLRFFEYLDKLVNEIIENEILFISEELTQRELISFLLSQKLELGEIISTFNKETDDVFYKEIYKYEELCMLYFDNFFKLFFESTKKNSLVCELAINISLLNFDISKNLNL